MDQEIKTVIQYPTGSTEFDIPFDYLSRKFVRVSLVSDDNRRLLSNITEYRYVSKTRVKLLVDTTGFDRVEIRRLTSASERIVDFSDGSVLRAADLNVSQIQSAHIAEEARDAALMAMPQDDAGNLDARNRRIVRLATGIDGTDAVNKDQLDKTLGDAGGILSDMKQTEKDVMDYIQNFADDSTMVKGVSWVYNNGAANGGETSFIITKTGPVFAVPFIEINGSRQLRNYHFEYDPKTKVVTLAKPLRKGDFVVCQTAEGTLPIIELLSGANGASEIGVKGGGTIQDVIDAPAVITGRVNIRNPYWNAPQDNAGDPDASIANSRAINKMFNSGALHVELDDKARHVSEPLLYTSSLSIHGAGRSALSLIWNGGDLPMIARSTYSDKDTRGASNVRLKDLRVSDLAPTRVKYYTIDLFNGNSNGLTDCWLDCPGRFNADGSRQITSDRYGVAIGVARNSTLPGDAGFVSHMRSSRITNGTLMINGTDWYVSGCELWGSFRNRAVEISGGGTMDGGTQLVPGAEAGIFLFSDVGFNIDTLKVIGVYFDGSTDKTLKTGWGIKSAAGIGLQGAQILGCNFWHINEGGIFVSKMYSSTVSSNFRDCDSDDTGEDDIVCDDMYGSRLLSNHHRGPAPKASDRVNLGRPFKVTGRAGFPLSTVGGEIGFGSAYIPCSVSGRDTVRSVGGSSLTSFQYSSLPPATNRVGEVIVMAGRTYISNGTGWVDATGATAALESPTDLDTATVLRSYYTSDLTKHTNIPPGVTGGGVLDNKMVTSQYITQILTVLKASGGVYSRSLTPSGWGQWSKIA